MIAQTERIQHTAESILCITKFSILKIVFSIIIVVISYDIHYTPKMVRDWENMSDHIFSVVSNFSEEYDKS